MELSEHSLYDLDEPNLSGTEQQLFDAVSRQEPWELVEKFSNLKREPGTEDEKEAAEFIAKRFDQYGISYEWHEPEFWIGEEESVSMEVTSPISKEFDKGTDRPAIKAQSFSGSGDVSGELIKLDLPEVNDVQELRGASLKDLGEADRNFTDKIVLVEEPLLSRQLVMDLQERGALAYLLVHPHPEEPHYGTASPVWGAIPTPDQTDLVPEMIIMNLSGSIGETLLDLLEENQEVEVDLHADVPREWIQSPLVVGKISGQAPSDNFVLLHGHYDSYNVGVTDNATGNAGMVEAARVLTNHQESLQRDLWIAFWPAHEGGRYGGSTWFAEHYAIELAERCVAHVNFDSPGVKDATEFEEMPVWMSEADDVCRGAIKDVAGKDATQNRPRRSGDYSFYNLGITGLMCLSSSIPKEIREKRGYHPVSGSGGNSEAWHLSTNTLDKADPDVLKRDIQIYQIILGRLLMKDILPLDYRQSVETYQKQLTEYQEAAGDHIDLTPIKTELSELEDQVNSLYQKIDNNAVDPDIANEILKQLQRHLVRINFTKKGPFEQDLAVSHPPFPKLEPIKDLSELTGNEYRFQMKELERAKNHIVYELRDAQRSINY